MEMIKRMVEEEIARVRVIHDDCSDEPEIGFTLLHWHRRYNMHSDATKIQPDDYRADDDEELEVTREQFFDRIADDHDLVCWWDLYMYEHGGSALSVGKGFSCTWDSGQVGIVGWTKEQWKTWWAEEWTGTDKQKEQALAAIICQIETLDHWHNGRVYGYIVTDDDGEEGDSCWGFYGLDWENGMADNIDEKYHDDLREALNNPEDR